MKKFSLIILLFSAAFTLMAQTNVTQQPAPAPANWSLSDMFTGKIGADIARGGRDLISFVENTTNNGVLSVEGGMLYAEKTKKIGGFLDAYLPVGGTNSLFGAGFGLAYLDENFYDATLNARLGDTFTLPFVHIPLYAYTEAGGGYNFSKNEIVSQAFAGALLKIPITQSQTLTLGGAIGTISDYPGNILALGGSYTFRF